MSSDSKGKKQILYPGLITLPPQDKTLTLRDQFAMSAMQGDFAAQDAEMGYYTNDTSDEFLVKRAEFCYRMADAMLKARGK
ncbi:hypothetical protein [Providencia sp. PROV087]|uniref:hypothetical protein n=1 Tax=Providencia sp. PROV087 TaxID=2949803 RepID=UPI0015EC117E|nr:hypothetical protein [Providencia sp. PROV087]QLQ99390.1 hypothetical protein H0912_09530 [Providencia rettgeri]